MDAKDQQLVDQALELARRLWALAHELKQAKDIARAPRVTAIASRAFKRYARRADRLKVAPRSKSASPPPAPSSVEALAEQLRNRLDEIDKKASSANYKSPIEAFIVTQAHRYAVNLLLYCKLDAGVCRYLVPLYKDGRWAFVACMPKSQTWKVTTEERLPGWIQEQMARHLGPQVLDSIAAHEAEKVLTEAAARAEAQDSLTADQLIEEAAAALLVPSALAKAVAAAAFESLHGEPNCDQWFSSPRTAEELIEVFIQGARHAAGLIAYYDLIATYCAAHEINLEREEKQARASAVKRGA
jgi:hypothetical protein